MALGNQPTKNPTNKVNSATALAAVTAILSWADDRFFGDIVPGYIEAAIITLAVFTAGYFTKNSFPDAPPADLIEEGD